MFLFAVEVRAAPQNAQTKYVVERIDLMGNRRVETDTLQALISSIPGHAYSIEAVRRDVRSLCNTGFFDDVHSEVEDSPHRPDAKIVIFIVREKPIVARIEYQGIMSITEPDILGALKEHKVELSVGSWFDQTKLNHAVAVIGQWLASHRHPSAIVKPTYERIPSSNTVALVFSIDEGPKAHK